MDIKDILKDKSDLSKREQVAELGANAATILQMTQKEVIESYGHLYSKMGEDHLEASIKFGLESLKLVKCLSKVNDIFVETLRILKDIPKQ